MQRTQRGFTLIELVMVIVILGILASIAVPRYLNLSTDASAAAREGVRGSLNSAIQIVRSRWLAKGATPGGTVTPDDGGTPITMSATGYPDVGAGLTYKDAASCATLVGSLLGGATPSSAASCTGVTVPLRTGFSAGACQVYSCPTDFPTPIALSASNAQ